MNNSEKINSDNFEERTNELAIKQQKEIDNFGDCNEQQATDLMQAAKIFAEIIYDIWAKEQNSKVIETDITPQIKIAA